MEQVASLSLGGASMDRHVVTKVRTHESKESQTTDDSSNSGGMSAHEIYGVEVVDINPITENLPVMTMEPMNKSLSLKSKTKKKNTLSKLLFGKKVKKKDSKAPKATCLIKETHPVASSVVSVSAPRTTTTTTKKKKKKATEAEHQPELPSSAPKIAPPSEITSHESKDTDAEDKIPTEEENLLANDTNKESDDPIEPNEGTSIEKPIEKKEVHDNKEVTIVDTDQIRLLDTDEAPDESVEATDVVGETRLAMISRGVESMVVVTKSIVGKEEEPVSESTKRSTRLAGFIKKSGEKARLTTPGEPKQSSVDTKANDPSNEPTESEQLKIGEVSGTNESSTEVTIVASKGASYVSNEDSITSQLIAASVVQKKNFKTTHVSEKVSDSEVNEQIVDKKVMNIENETEKAEMNATKENDVSNYEEASEKSFDDSDVGEEYDLEQMDVLLKSDVPAEVGNIISSAPEVVQLEVSTITAEEESDDLIEKESGPIPESEPTDSSSKTDQMSEVPDIQCTDLDSDTLVNIFIDTVLCGNNCCGTDADKGDNLDKALRVLFFDDETCATYDDDLSTLGTLDDLDDVSIAAYILKRHATRLGVSESELLKKINKEQGMKKFLPRKFDGTRKIPARIPSKIPSRIPVRRASRSSLSGLFKGFKLNRACCHPQGMAEF